MLTLGKTIVTMLCWSVMSDVVLKAAHTLIVAFQAAKDEYAVTMVHPQLHPDSTPDSRWTSTAYKNWADSKQQPEDAMHGESRCWSLLPHQLERHLWRCTQSSGVL
jgi:hypothetical protein